MFRFAQQHAVITGGSSGIGQAVAIQLAAAGANITIIARDSKKLEQAAIRIRAACVTSTQHVYTYAVDTTDARGMFDAVQRCADAAGPPTMLVACAGRVVPGLFRDMPLRAFTDTMAVNYVGTVHAVKAVLPYMEAKRCGHVVLVSSGAGVFGIYGYSSYSPSKFALQGLAEVLATELKPQGIGVSIVYPPDTDTPQLAEENKTKPVATRAITAGARVLSPEKVARAIVDGIARKKFTITPGFEMTLLARLRGLLVPLLRWQMDRTVSQCLASVDKSVGGSMGSVGGDVDAVDFRLSRSTSSFTS